MIRDNRLYSIVELIDKEHKILLDIGVDHGFLIKKAFDANKIKQAIAADINELPLENAKKNLSGYNVSYILSDGFKNIKTNFDLVAIAGLGANTIIEILKAAPNNDITYILQANNKVERLRDYLTNNEYKIIDELIVLENDRYYIIIKAIKGHQALTDIEKYLGPILMTKVSSKPYYEHKLQQFYYLINHKGAKELSFNKEINYLKSAINIK